MNKQLRCCNCNKVIAEEISIQAGVVKITCKCGTVNEVKAEPKEQKPYGERQNYIAKDWGEDHVVIEGDNKSMVNFETEIVKGLTRNRFQVKK